MVPGEPVGLPMSTPPVTSLQKFVSFTPRIAHVDGNTVGSVNPEPFTAKSCAAMEPDGRLLINCGVSTQFCARLLPLVRMCSKEKKPNSLFFQIGPPRLPKYSRE